MLFFKPNLNKESNTNNTTIKNNVGNKNIFKELAQLFNYTPQILRITKFNFLQKSDAETSNNTNLIRITKNTEAIRLDERNYFTGKFNSGFPRNSVYSFCEQKLAIIFKNGPHEYSRKVLDNRNIRVGAGTNSYPLNISIEKVSESIQNNQYGKNFTGGLNCSSAGGLCPNGTVPDPITGLCAKTRLCMPEPQEECPPVEIVNLKNTIYGYAVYVDVFFQTINIPNIGPRPVRCAGGHRCNQTVFMPKLKLNDNSVIDASNPISMDNLESLSSWTPQFAPFAPFNPSYVTDSFSFTVSDPSLLDDTCLFTLECQKNICHRDVTMIYLVGQRSDNDEYVLLFADCVAPGLISGKPLGYIPCNDYDPPIPCNGGGGGGNDCDYIDFSGNYILDWSLEEGGQLLSSDNPDVTLGTFTFYQSENYFDIFLYPNPTLNNVSYVHIRYRIPIRYRYSYGDWSFWESLIIDNTLSETEFVKVVGCCNTEQLTTFSAGA